MNREDKLVTCRRCGGNACYEQTVDTSLKVWLCMGCGFTTTTDFKTGSEIVEKTIESSPELYRDLSYQDTDELIWFPSTITLPEKGMVFIDGTSVEDWQWGSVIAVTIPEEEKTKYPKDQIYKMDMKNIKHYAKNNFMDALDNIGFFKP